MTLNINPQALELQTKKIEREVFNTSFFLKKKISVIKRGILIPDDLIAEIESFRERNTLATLKGENEKVVHKCCQQCLKAHIISKSKEIGLDDNSISYLDNIMGCETGHSGYYLDNNNLKKL